MTGTASPVSFLDAGISTGGYGGDDDLHIICPHEDCPWVHNPEHGYISLEDLVNVVILHLREHNVITGEIILLDPVTKAIGQGTDG